MYTNNYATIDENIKRMKSLMGNTKPVTQVNEQQLGNIEKVYKGKDGFAYAIVKENAHYFLKKSPKDRDLTLNDFEYLGGNRQCKNLYEFNSYNQAEKVLKEELVAIAKNVDKKQLFQEEVQRIDNNLKETVKSKEMRKEIDRIREIMENASRINVTGSTSVVKKANLNEKVNIGDSAVICDNVENVDTANPGEEKVNEVLGLVGSAIGSVAGSAARGVGNAVGGAVSGVKDAAGTVGDAITDSKDEEEISLDDEEEFDLDSEFDDEEELDVDSEFDDEEFGGEEEGGEMEMLHALMDKLNAIEEKLSGDLDNDDEFMLDDEEEDSFGDTSESGNIEEGGYLSPKLNQKYNVSPKEVAEKRADFDRAILGWIKNQEPYLTREEVLEKLEEKLAELKAEEEMDDEFEEQMTSPEKVDNYGKMGIKSGDDERNFSENLRRNIKRIIKETINTVASDVTKDKFGYNDAEPDTEGRTTFDDLDSEENIDYESGFHKDTLGDVKSTANVSALKKGSSCNASVCDTEEVIEIVDEGIVGGYVGAKVAPGLQGANQSRRLDNLEKQVAALQKGGVRESKKNKDQLFIVETDGTVVAKIPRSALKK